MSALDAPVNSTGPPTVDDFIGATSTLDARDNLAALLGSAGSTPELALALVASYSGPVDGVATPSADLGYPSGTLAIRMVQRHWAEFDDTQRHAIAATIGPIDGVTPDGDTPSAARGFATGQQRIVRPEQTALDDLVARLANEQAARMGVPSMANRIVTCVGRFARWKRRTQGTAALISDESRGRSAATCGYVIPGPVLPIEGHDRVRGELPRRSAALPGSRCGRLTIATDGVSGVTRCRRRQRRREPPDRSRRP